MCCTNVSVRLEPGRHTATVGPSGEGKTTLAHLLVRFWSPEGRIDINGQIA